MKRLSLLILSVACCCLWGHADEVDERLFLQEDIIGTPRYMSMSGAFLALGSDPSAVYDNPAALGVCRTPNISLSMAYIGEQVKTNWAGNQQKDYNHSFAFPQANMTFVFDRTQQVRPLQYHSLMLGYRRVNNLSRSLSARAGAAQNTSFTDYIALFTDDLTEADVRSEAGYDPYMNINVGWLSILGYNAGLINPSAENNTQWNSLLNAGEQVTPAFTQQQSGWRDQYTVAWGGNFNDRVYVGASVLIDVMHYTKRTSLSEHFGQGGAFQLDSYYHLSSFGFGGSLGAIWKPVQPLRIAVSVKSPMFVAYDEFSNARMTARNILTDIRSTDELTDNSDTEHLKFHTPTTVSAGVAYTFSKGLLSFEYDWNTLHTFRVGTEWVLPKNVYLRAGYALRSPLKQDQIVRELPLNTVRTDFDYTQLQTTQYIGAGIGYRSSFLVAELAYQCRLSRENLFTHLLQTEPIEVSGVGHRLVLLIGIN